MATGTFTIRGQRVRSASQRRYIVVAYRPAGPVKRWSSRAGDYMTENMPEMRPTIVARSDSADQARKRMGRHGGVAGGWIVVVDTVTGEELRR